MLQVDNNTYVGAGGLKEGCEIVLGVRVSAFERLDDGDCLVIHRARDIVVSFQLRLEMEALYTKAARAWRQAACRLVLASLTNGKGQ